MSGYVIANIDVKNPEAYKEYVGKVVPTVQKIRRRIPCTCWGVQSYRW